MVSKQERFVKKHAARLNPSIPLEYSPLLPGVYDIPVRAGTDLRRAIIKLDETWKPTGDFLVRKGDGLDSGLEVACREIVAHEIAGHVNSEFTEGCPGDDITHALMKNRTIEALKKVKKRGASYMTNAVQDVIANTIVGGIPTHTNSGFTLFYVENLKTPNPFYEAFVKLNLACWGQLPDISHLRPYFTNQPKINKAWKAVVKELKLDPCNPEHNRKILLDKDRWADFSYTITKHLGPLLDNAPKRPTSPTRSGKPQGDDDSQGSPSGGQDDSDQEAQDDSDHQSENESDTGNPFEERLKDPSVQRKVARKFYDQGLGKPKFMPTIEALLRLYESLGDMPLQAKTETFSLGVPIIPYQFKHTTDLNRASLTKFGMGADGKLAFYEPTERLDVPFNFNQHKQDFPDLVIAVLDRSPSMLLDLEPKSDTSYIPWGDKSKWHYTLWAWFALTNDLARTGKIQYVKNNALLYADDTKESGAYTGRNLDQLRRWILSNPPGDWGGTSLDMKKIRKNCQGGPKVLITVSDGEVSNWTYCQSEFLELTAPHLYAHIQIGPHSEMSLALKKNKRQVYLVRKGSELISHLRGITAEAYQ